MMLMLCKGSCCGLHIRSGFEVLMLCAACTSAGNMCNSLQHGTHTHLHQCSATLQHPLCVGVPNMCTTVNANYVSGPGGMCACQVSDADNSFCVYFCVCVGCMEDGCVGNSRHLLIPRFASLCRRLRREGRREGRGVHVCNPTGRAGSALWVTDGGWFQHCMILGCETAQTTSVHGFVAAPVAQLLAPTVLPPQCFHQGSVWCTMRGQVHDRNLSHMGLCMCSCLLQSLHFWQVLMSLNGSEVCGAGERRGGGSPTV